jgi:hypothetical protein
MIFLVDGHDDSEVLQILKEAAEGGRDHSARVGTTIPPSANFEPK